jgi:uncharacterized membrane protein
MPKTSKSITIHAPIKEVYRVVTDFESYPAVFSEVRGAKVIKQDKKTAIVDFVFHVITTIKCQLKFNLTPTRISWKLIKGDFMSDNVGAWDLEEKDGATKAAYTVDITPTMWVPVSVLEQLIENNAPHMLKSLKSWCEKRTKTKKQRSKN